MGLLLIVLAYAAVLSFIMRVLWRIFMLVKTPTAEANTNSGMGISAFARSVLDIFFLGRLFRANPRLWLGEWVFHLSFILLIFWHLRFLIEPVPAWIWRLRTLGTIASYSFLISILYISAVRFIAERKKYFSRYNLFLLVLSFLIGLTGFIIRHYYPADLAGIKDFAMAIVCLKPRTALPASTLFPVHFSLAMIFLASLPSHIFAAPFTMTEAAGREKNLSRLLHD